MFPNIKLTNLFIRGKKNTISMRLLILIIMLNLWGMMSSKQMLWNKEKNWARLTGKLNKKMRI